MKLGLPELVKELQSLKKKVKCLRCEVNQIEGGGGSGGDMLWKIGESDWNPGILGLTNIDKTQNIILESQIALGPDYIKSIDLINPGAVGSTILTNIGGVEERIDTTTTQGGFKVNGVYQGNEVYFEANTLSGIFFRHLGLANVSLSGTVFSIEEADVKIKKFQNTEVTNVFSDTTGTLVNVQLGGQTSGRPGTPYLYQSYFDSDLNKPIWYNGADWIDATGTIV